MIRPLTLALALVLAAAPTAQRPAPGRIVAETDGARTLVHQVEIAAPVGDVWAAIATAEGWRSWAVPLARTVEGAPDLIETSYNPAAVPAGPDTIRQQLIARIPGRLLAFRTVKAPEGFRDFETFAKVVNVFELEPRGESRTLVRLTGHPFPDDEAGRRLLDFFDRGNALSLDMLRRRFAEGPVDWTNARK